MGYPKVSIIIPIYNAEQYLIKCLRNLLRQSLSSIEFIFIDDCSTDQSFFILKEFFLSHPEAVDKIQIYQMAHNSGVSNVRNYGLSLANGDYIGWVDADDWVVESMFERLYNLAVKFKADIVWCDYTNVFETHQLYVSQRVVENGKSCIAAMLEGNMLGSVWNKLVKRELYESYNIKFPSGLNMCEDLRVNIQLFHYASTICYDNFGGYFYVKHKDDSISAKAMKETNINYEWIENVSFIVDFVETNYPKFNKQILDKFKLEPKKNLLIHGKTINSFKEWKLIFPNSNYAVEFTNYPFYYKFLALCIERGWWFFVRFWIVFKYKLLCR